MNDNVKESPIEIPDEPDKTVSPGIRYDEHPKEDSIIINSEEQIEYPVVSEKKNKTGILF